MKKTIQTWLVLLVMLFGCGSGTTNDNSSVPLCDLPCSVTRADGVTVTVVSAVLPSGASIITSITTGPLTIDLGQVLINNYGVRASVNYILSTGPGIAISPTITPGVGLTLRGGGCSSYDVATGGCPSFIEIYWVPSVVGKLEAALTVTTGLVIPITGEGIQ